MLSNAAGGSHQRSVGDSKNMTGHEVSSAKQEKGLPSGGDRAFLDRKRVRLGQHCVDIVTGERRVGDTANDTCCGKGALFCFWSPSFGCELRASTTNRF